MKDESGIHLLILRIGSGDIEAYAELDRHIHPLLSRYIARHFRSQFQKEDIEYIVDQAILTICLHAGEYRGRHGDPSALKWIYRIAGNQALKWLKTLQRTIHFPDSDPSNGSGGEEELMTLVAIQRHLDPNSMSVEEMVFERIFRDQVLFFISTLSRRERLILFLRFEMQWTFNQIAEFIHVKPARVHQILQSIFMKCRYAFE